MVEKNLIDKEIERSMRLWKTGSENERQAIKGTRPSRAAARSEQARRSFARRHPFDQANKNIAVLTTEGSISVRGREKARCRLRVNGVSYWGLETGNGQRDRDTVARVAHT